MPTATAINNPSVDPNTLTQNQGQYFGDTSNLGVATPNFTDVNANLPNLNIPATDAGSATASNSGGLSSILSGLGTVGTDIGSILNSPLGTLAQFGGEYALISNQAKNTQTQNNALAGQISAIGAPDVTAGKSLLDSYTA